MWGHKFRQRSANNVIAELHHLKNEFGIDAFIISDDTFCLNRKWVLDFCVQLNESNLGLKWMCNARVNLVDEEILQALKKAGCITIGFGIESGSDLILNELNKKTTRKRIDSALSLTKKFGFKILTYLIIGSPSDTVETVTQTIELLKKHKLSGGFNYLTPIPGTKLFNKYCPDQNKLTTDELLMKWSKWQDYPMVNLTNSLTTQELIHLKNKAEMNLNIYRLLTLTFFRDLKAKVKKRGLKSVGLEYSFDLLKRKVFNNLYSSKLKRITQLRNKSIDPKSVQRILVIKLYGIGNVILSVPLLKNIKHHFPNAKITLIVEDRAKEIAYMLNSYYDCLTIVSMKNTLTCKIDLVKKLMSSKADVIFSTFPMTNNNISRLLPFISSKYIIGYPQPGFEKFYTHPLSFYYFDHEVILNLKMLHCFRGRGLSDLDDSLETQINLDVNHNQLLVIQKAKKKYKFVIGFHCGSRIDLKQKRWSEKNFSELMKILSSQYECMNILLGGFSEINLNTRIAQEINEGALNMAGKLTLKETCAVMKNLDLIITNDSGLLHVATLIGVPAVALFGPTNEKKNGPWGDPLKYTILKSDMDCRPCHAVGKPLECNDPKCINNIKITDVLEVVLERLGIN